MADQQIAAQFNGVGGLGVTVVMIGVISARFAGQGGQGDSRYYDWGLQHVYGQNVWGRGVWGAGVFGPGVWG